MACEYQGRMARPPKSQWVRADFNGLFGNVLCISHGPTCTNESGDEVALSPGLQLTAFDQDADEHGNRDDLVASGVVEPSPEWLQCRGSRWVLRIDEDGVKSESEI
jgi:hypothetical protein